MFIVISFFILTVAGIFEAGKLSFSQGIDSDCHFLSKIRTLKYFQDLIKYNFLRILKSFTSISVHEFIDLISDAFQAYI